MKDWKKFDKNIDINEQLKNRGYYLFNPETREIVISPRQDKWLENGIYSHYMEIEIPEYPKNLKL